MDYDLAKLIPWTRNACGDRPKLTQEELVGTGMTTLTLSNSGGITLSSVTVDGEVLDADAVSVEDNVLTFVSPPDVDTDVVVTYTLTRYTNADLRSFLADAAMAIASDLPARFVVLHTSGVISVPDDLLDNESGEPQATLQQLIVYKAAMDIMADKANQAADAAITIRDGDTTIDTSRSSQSGETALKRMTARYDQALLRAKNSRLRGTYLLYPPQ